MGVKKFGIAAALGLMFVLLCSGFVRAQIIDLSSGLPNGGAEQVWRSSIAEHRAGVWLDQGDVSQGDDRSDLIIGAPGGPGVVGTVYVLFGGAVRTGELSLDIAEVIIRGPAAGDGFGTSTAAGYILRKEGVSPRDLLVGAPNGQGGRGEVYLFAGGLTSRSALTTANAVLRVVGAPGDRLGAAVTTGDLDGDGFRDLVLGAPGTSRVYVVKGGPTVASIGTLDLSLTAPMLTITGPNIGGVLATGDITGWFLNPATETAYDLLIGAPTASWLGCSECGAVYVVRARPSAAFPPSLSLPIDANAIFTGVNAGDRAGTSIVTRDFDNDRIRDVLIGAPGGDGPLESRPESGEAYILWGGPTLASRSLSVPDVFMFGPTGGALGALVTAEGSGGLNTDEYDDMLLLAAGARGGVGEIYAYHGRPRTAVGIPFAGARAVDLAVAGQANRQILGDPAGGAITSIQQFDVTGESAQEIVAGAAGAGSGAGAIYVSFSPTLRVVPGTVSLTVREGQQVTNSLVVSNLSKIPIPWEASSNRPWLQASPAAGAASVGSNASITLVAAAPGLAPGVHTGQLTVAANGPDLHRQARTTVNLTLSATRVAFNTPAGGSTSVQPFTISGWALDLGSSTNSGVDAVHVWAVPNPGSGEEPFFVGEATYGISRADVAAAFGSRYTASGFSLRVTGLKPGPYEFVAYARSALTGTFDKALAVRTTVQAQPRLALDTPRAGISTRAPFVVTGWAIDAAAASGTGVDQVHLWATAVGGSTSPFFLGVATYGVSRPDVGAAFGAQFTNSAFGFVVGNLLPGVYDISVFARSTVSGTFNNTHTIRVTVERSPFIAVDRPGAGGAVTGAFQLSGWAVDLTSPTGTGVDTLHVWAHPTSGASPFFIGVAAYGTTRADVGAVFGSRFGPSGYSLTVSHLPPGVYDIVVWARSTVTGTFNNSKTVRVQVLAGPYMAIGVPAGGATVAGAFDVRGWAVDLAAPTGTGVNEVHVWAFPTDGSTPRFLGAATYGRSRPDIGSLFGARFTNSGFALAVSGLPPGTYDIGVYARSTVTGTFNNSTSVRVTVGGS